MAAMRPQTILEQSAYFTGLPERSRRALARVCQPRELGRRDTLFIEGRRGTSLYLLSSGSIQLVKTSPDGKDVVIKTVVPGEVFAEVVLFEQDRYPVTAIAVKNCVVYELPRAEFERLLEDRIFRTDFISSLFTRLRYMADRLLSFTTSDVEARLFDFLREQYGEKDEYQVSISKKDIAAAIGTTPETLSRLILRLKKQKMLAWQGKRIRLQKDFWSR